MSQTLHRRHFLIGTGSLLGVAAFQAACGSSPYVAQRDAFEQLRSSGEPPIVKALRVGITAPSAHNTQPWLIKLVSDTEARIYTDKTRLLPLTDPPHRQIHISHGTLLEMIAIVAPQLGYSAQIEVLPDGEVTPAHYGLRATGAIRLIEDSSAREPLFAATMNRRSSRLVHIGEAPTSKIQAEIVAAAAGPGIIPAFRTNALKPLHDIVKRAMAIEARDRSLYGETLAWFRFSAAQVNKHQDGLNLQTAGADTFAARHLLDADNFLEPSNVERFLSSFDEVVDSTSAYLSITTPEGNTMRDWIEVGRSYLRAQLTAGAAGFRFHPVSQALQEFEQMSSLRDELGALYPVAAPGKLQLLVRCGRTEEPAISPRRPLEAMMP